MDDIQILASASAVFAVRSAGWLTQAAFTVTGSVFSMIRPPGYMNTDVQAHVPQSDDVILRPIWMSRTSSSSSPLSDPVVAPRDVTEEHIQSLIIYQEELLNENLALQQANRRLRRVNALLEHGSFRLRQDNNALQLRLQRENDVLQRRLRQENHDLNSERTQLVNINNTLLEQSVGLRGQNDRQAAELSDVQERLASARDSLDIAISEQRHAELALAAAQDHLSCVTRASAALENEHLMRRGELLSLEARYEAANGHLANAEEQLDLVLNQITFTKSLFDRQVQPAERETVRAQAALDRLLQDVSRAENALASTLSPITSASAILEGIIARIGTEETRWVESTADDDRVIVGDGRISRLAQSEHLQEDDLVSSASNETEYFSIEDEDDTPRNEIADEVR